MSIELTQAQLDRAAQGSAAGGLWVQGGLVNDQLMNGTFPGKYGFAALRCAIDNLNGDNVEFVSFPANQTHMFCYAYYVTPPPKSGTIIIKKAVPSGVNTAAPAFWMR